ncbi:hypothetical protein SASPL_150533 [Salvia splendens]|uniref:Uncharacterized protein n=1 Tax=Salvia splendens TaxID=180675 RepID=A0A8X8W6Z5_SALSN|nr:hypothetical protein SASPL_150533 [Salvia splendens]
MKAKEFDIFFNESVHMVYQKLLHEGSSHMTWKQKKDLENKKVVSLGGKRAILGRFGAYSSSSSKKVPERKPTEDRILKSMQGDFRKGFLNIGHLLKPSAPEASNYKGRHPTGKGKKKKDGKKSHGKRKGGGGGGKRPRCRLNDHRLQFLCFTVLFRDDDTVSPGSPFVDYVDLTCNMALSSEKGMTMKAKGTKRESSSSNLDSQEPRMDIKSILKDIEFLGSSHMTWKQKKDLENKKVVSLGGKPPKKQRLPLSVARVSMKNQKDREEKLLQEVT